LLAIVISQTVQVTLLNQPFLDPAFPPTLCSILFASLSPQSPQNPVRFVNQGFAHPRRSHPTVKLVRLVNQGFAQPRLSHSTLKLDVLSKLPEIAVQPPACCLQQLRV
jgi:hypothetical protein